MAKWQQVKIVLQGWAYFGTGIVLILGGLVMLGIIMDELATSYYIIDGQMPILIEWTPLFLMLVVIGWGAYFINKGIKTAGRLFFYLLGKATCKILQLHRVSYKAAILSGGAIALAGFVIICAKMGPAIFADELPITPPTVVLVGIALILMGVAIVEYIATERHQELATKI